VSPESIELRPGTVHACPRTELQNMRKGKWRSALRQVMAAAVLALGVQSWSQTTVNIHAIQTDLPSSPYLAQSVTTTGIVIAVLSDGFYIENADADFDSNVCTAEGIYVYTPTGVPSNVAMQASVTVTGVVQASNQSSYAGTQIYIASPDSTNVVLNSTGNTLPSSISSATRRAERQW